MKGNFNRTLAQRRNLWPERKGCAGGCLLRFEESRPGYLINIEALRPFERN
jgi:hypothetical protein